MQKEPAITIWRDHESASIAAAHLFVTLCKQSIAKRGTFTVALSGGNTPKRLYEILATNEFSSNIPWKNVFLFWSDERFVPASDPDSNYRMTNETLLQHINIPKENIFPIPVSGQAKQCAANYEDAICSHLKKQKNRFDCILLGIGNDGHTASLFPGTTILKEKKRLVKEIWVEDKQTWRISFTLPLINNANSIVFLTTGKEKTGIVENLLSRKNTKTIYPAQLVRPEKGYIYWILDQDAAAKI